ncbi:hypothetical protein RJ639_011396 [Escallonia herrerae]|uniref:Uncharacterized protein n=1 Tax=Escallonia herrerae TaxID=1293975 RepID=A0AA88VKZ0_9ASTE|nr:hypothetical protein RJ639_011396 [Escallonia herrerae]
MKDMIEVMNKKDLDGCNITANKAQSCDGGSTGSRGGFHSGICGGCCRKGGGGYGCHDTTTVGMVGEFYRGSRNRGNGAYIRAIALESA